MTTATATATAPEVRSITHKDLPETDGTVPNNYMERPQTALLTGAMTPILRRRFPEGRYSIGSDSLIYFWLTEPRTRGARAPDWFLVVGVEPMLEGECRRSYVLWNELISPLIVIEYVSGDGSEERSRTEREGKFWIYEKAIKATYYAIHDGFRGTLELYRNDGNVFQAVQANERGRCPIPELGVELGLWQGTAEGIAGWYVRPWDSGTGEMLPSYEDDRARVGEAERIADDMRRELAEEAEQTQQARRAEEEARRQADEARQKAERLAERLRQLGIDPEAA